MVTVIAITSILFFTLAIITFFSNKSKRTKWMSALFLIGFLFSITQLSQITHIIPSLFRKYIAFIHAFFFPYCLLMLSITVLNLPRINKYFKYLQIFSLISIFIFFIIDPSVNYIGNYAIYRKITSIKFFMSAFVWSTIYVISAITLLILSIFQEKNHTLKKDNIFTTLLFGPTSIIILIKAYLQPLISNEVHSKIFIILTLVIFIPLILIVFFTWGFYGIKFKIEKYSYETTKNSDLGTSIINHAIKNEIQKLAVCAEVIKINHDPKNLTMFKHHLQFYTASDRNDQPNPIHIHGSPSTTT